MRRYFIDASVILKTILKESDSVARKVGGILKLASSGKTEILSQKLLAIEVANGFRYGTKEVSESLEYFKVFLKLPIKYVISTKTQLKKVIETSFELDTTVYDTSYHILAKAHNAVFLTCDEDYYKKAKVLGDVELL